MMPCFSDSMESRARGRIAGRPCRGLVIPLNARSRSSKTKFQAHCGQLRAWVAVPAGQPRCCNDRDHLNSRISDDAGPVQERAPLCLHRFYAVLIGATGHPDAAPHEVVAAWRQAAKWRRPQELRQWHLDLDGARAQPVDLRQLELNLACCQQAGGCSVRGWPLETLPERSRAWSWAKSRAARQRSRPRLMPLPQSPTSERFRGCRGQPDGWLTNDRFRKLPLRLLCVVLRPVITRGPLALHDPVRSFGDYGHVNG